MKRKPLVVGTLLLLAGLIWQPMLSASWTDRLPAGWSFASRYTGTQTYADPRTGLLPPRDVLSEYERVQWIEAGRGGSGSVVLHDRLTIRDPVTGEVVWEYATAADLDRRTGAHLAKPFRGDVAVFPRHVQAAVYRLRTNYLKGVPLAFEGEDDIEDIKVYVFSYQGPAEYTESYAGTTQFPGVTTGPGREIRCADNAFYYRVWVEPLTGEAVKVEEGCPSGDYVYEIATGQRLQAVDRWSGVTAGDALVRRVAEVRGLRLRYLWASRYGTLLLLGGAAVALSIAAMSWRASRP